MDTHNCGCGECGGNSAEHCDCGECQTLTLALDDGTQIVCNVIGVFGVAETDYIALQPQDDDEVMVFRYTELDDGIQLDSIESEEEHKQVIEAFEAMFEEDDFDEDFDFDDFEDADDDLDFDDDDDDLDFDDEDESF